MYKRQTFNSGSLDSGYSIDIRGVASINGGSPLVLADGMEDVYKRQVPFFANPVAVATCLPSLSKRRCV